MIIQFDACSAEVRDGKVWLCLRPTADTKLQAQQFAAAVRDSKHEYDADLKRHYDKRSKEANAYMWRLCDEIAKVLRSTKEEVYREMIGRVGVFDDVYVAVEASHLFVQNWRKNGTGYLAEMMGDKGGYSCIRAYTGSSKYDTAQMSRLIDEVVSEAQGLGIETKTPDEIANMVSLWGEKA